MTAPGPTTLQCPKCYEQHVMIGASGNAICPDCAHTWNPDNPLETATPRPAPFGLPGTDEVFGTPDNGAQPETWTCPNCGRELPGPIDHACNQTPEDYYAADELAEALGEPYVEPIPRFDPAEWVGGVAILEGGQHATIVSFASDDTLIVRLSNDDLEQVKLADTTSMLPPIPDVEPVQLPESEEELTPDLALALRLARVIVASGAESLYCREISKEPQLPPTGFLPTEPELLPVIERAIGMAFAMMIEVFDVPVIGVIEWAELYNEPNEVATETTEVSE